MRKKYLSIGFALWLSLQTSGCAHRVPDVPVCTEISVIKGFCVNSLSSKEFFIDDEHPYSATGDKADAMTWWELRPLMIMLPYLSWVEIKAFIIKICKDTNQCTGEIGNWERTVGVIDQQLEPKLP